jgi:hypothetical protein
MKKTLTFFVAILLLSSMGCKKKTANDYLPGTWTVNSMNVVVSDSAISTDIGSIPATVSIQSNSNGIAVSGSTGSSSDATLYKSTSFNSDSRYVYNINFSGQLTINKDGTFSYTYSNQQTQQMYYQDGVLVSTLPLTTQPSLISGRGVWEWGATQKSNSMLKLKDVNLGTAFSQPFDAFTVKSISENVLELSFENTSTTTAYPNATTTSYQIKKASTYIKLTK